MGRQPGWYRHGVAWLACAAGVVAWTAVAQAEDDLSGEWVTGPTRMQVSVQSWGEDCGPRPSSSTSKGGRTVEVEQSGNQVVIHSGTRAIRTGACWSRNPAIRRESSSYLGGQWTTICKTPSNDPREETGTYTLQQKGNDSLLYKDSSRYNWKLKDSSCVATISTTQTLTRKAAARSSGSNAGESPGSSDKTTANNPARARRARCTPGRAAKLSLSPGSAVLQLGGEQCFRARLLDAKGCALSSNVRLALEHPPALKGTLDGRCFRAEQSAAEGEGTFTIVATGGGFTARATVEVKSLDLSALIAQRIDDVATTDDQEARSEALSAAAPAQKSKVAARAVDNEASPLLPILGATLALLLLVLALLLMRRRGRPVATDSAVPPIPDAGGAGASDVAAGAAAPVPVAGGTTSSHPPPTAGQQWICPSCRRGYPAAGDCSRCGPEPVPLIPYQEFLQRQRSGLHRRRCKDCGAEWDSPANFCADCGSRNLEDV